MVSELHRLFDESVVIARVFVTVPFDELPDANKEFVKSLAETSEAGTEIRGTTPVLSLIGTHGLEADWNDRTKSKRHVGIPLISFVFVDTIPLISRLLKELSMPLTWVDSHESEIIRKVLRGSTGLFYVEDAARATDHEGRKIIAQDFVSQYNVKSVFGIGEAYGNGQMLVVIVFCRDTFPKEVSVRFLAIVDSFVSRTASLLDEGKIFSDSR
ncbi:MAG: hypothetical protein P8Y63_00455 [Deltaproteobacteria bacterium]